MEMRNGIEIMLKPITDEEYLDYFARRKEHLFVTNNLMVTQIKITLGDPVTYNIKNGMCVAEEDLPGKTSVLKKQSIEDVTTLVGMMRQLGTPMTFINVDTKEILDFEATKMQALKDIEEIEGILKHIKRGSGSH
jgi:hypothetical protein